MQPELVINKHATAADLQLAGAPSVDPHSPRTPYARRTSKMMVVTDRKGKVKEGKSSSFIRCQEK